MRIYGKFLMITCTDPYLKTGADVILIKTLGFGKPGLKLGNFRSLGFHDIVA